MKALVVLFLFLIGNFANSAKVHQRVRRQSECKIPSRKLHEIRAQIGKIIGDGDSNTYDCENLMTAGIGFSSRLRNQERKSRKTFDDNHNRKNGTSDPLKSVRESYIAVLKEQRDLWIKLDYYSFYTESQDPQQYANDKNICSMSSDNGKKFLSILKEIHQHSTRKIISENCEFLVDKMMNVVSIIKRSDSFKNDVLALYEKNDEAELREEIKLKQDEIENMKKDLKMNAEKFIIKCIKEDELFLAKEAFSDVDSSSYEDILIKTYSCDKSTLYNLVRFAEYYKRSGLSVITEQMKVCKHTEDPIVLRLVKILNNDELNLEAEKAYQKLAERIREGNSKDVADTSRKIFADLAKLVKLAYNKDVKNFESSKDFINKLPDQKLETVLYDEMIASEHVDTVEHIDFALWLKDRIREIDQLDLSQTDINLKKSNLVKLKDRLPDGIKILIFESDFIFSTPNFEQLFRAYGHDSVKFKLIPQGNGFFRFNDTKTNASPVLHKPGNYNERIVEIGVGEGIKYHWKIIPIENATRFLIKSAAGNYYISSDEYKKCMVGKGKCSKHESYNIAYENADRENQKWIITTRLIRNGILADRTSIKLSGNKK